jgi:autotransporter-associated beta strand protein
MKHCTSLFAALVVFALSVSTVQAQLYWDVNGITAGSADSTDATGTWDATSTTWNATSTGDTTAPAAWIADSVANFSATGNGASGYTVHLADAESASGLTFNDTLVTIDSTGGTLTLSGATPTVTVAGTGNAATITAPIAGTGGLSLTGGTLSQLTLSGANTYSGATTFGGGAVLQLGATGAIPDGSVLTMLNGSTQTKFDMNGKDETVRSISSGGTTSTNSGTIAIGSQTLTINDQTGDVNQYTGLYTGTSSAKIIKNGNGTLQLNNFPTVNWAGEFVINSGTVELWQNNAVGAVAKLTINGGTLKRNNITLNLAVRTIDITNSFTFDNTGSNDAQLNGLNGASTTTLKTDPVITVIGTTGTFIFAGDIVDDGTVRGFTKAGPGTLTLGSKGNAYRGETTIQEGFLRVRKQTNSGNIGTARIGDGIGRVNLSGGTLEFNGSVITAGDPRTFTVTNPLRVTADNSGIRYVSTTTGLGATNTIDFIFSSNDITGTGGNLTFSNAGSCTDNGNTCIFRPTFSNSGFDFSRPVVINNHTSVATRSTQLVSTNTSGTQTWSGAISGTGTLLRNGAGGTTLLSGANTFSGATVQAGTLTASGASATLGGGNVTVTGGNIEIVSGVADAIANATAALSLAGGGTAGVADVAYASLGAGINERVDALLLNGVGQANGITYGSTSSSALVQNNEYFAGTGIVSVGVPGDFNNDNSVDAADYVTWRTSPGTYAGTPGYNLWRSNFGATGPGAGGGTGLGVGATVPEPSSVALLMLGFAALASRRRRS